MLHRELIEQELFSSELFIDQTRALYHSGRWPELFLPRTVQEFQTYASTHPMPDDPILRSIFQNNTSSCAGESLLFQEQFDIRVFPTMHYNLGCIHYHDFFEITYLIRGTCTQLINGATIDTQCGDFIVLAPGVSHYVQMLDDNSLGISIAIRKSTFHDAFFGIFNARDILSDFFSKALDANASSPYLLFRTGSDSNVLDQLYEMYYECAHPIAYSRQALNNRMSNLFIYLLRYHQQHVLVGNDDVHHTVTLLPILDYIQSNLATVTLQELSDRFHYHTAYISKAIKEETGKSFNDLKQTLRIQKAAELLSRTELPLQQIAADLGYSDQSHFTRHFRTVYQLTPRAYRNQQRAQTS
jgi:AraC-like DNA-binding protein